MRLQHDDLHTLTGSYAVDALPAEEMDEFERHLTHCGSCTAEVRGLRETASRLALITAERPPAAMRDRVLAAAGRTRQLPPITENRPARSGPRAIRSARSARRARRSYAPHSAWIPRIAVGVAAAAVAVAGVFGINQHNTQQRLGAIENQLTAARAHNTQIDSVLAAGDLHLVSSKTGVGGSVSAIVSTSQAKLVVVTSGLPALPAGKVYELWLLGTNVAKPSGLLTTAAHGRTVPVVASGLVKGYKLGVTVEPAGGTLKPTTNPILAMPLST
ncbi:MAG TPA: anti-sigma factor [Streptosporangiaceae bacterium]|nr:anti-sigma factor [Streptosporangiaceae bacterium]